MSDERLLELVQDGLNEVLELILTVRATSFLFLQRKTLVSESDNAEGSVLVVVLVSEGLEEATSVGEEGFGGLVGLSILADARENVDTCKVAAVCEHRHGRHRGGFDVVANPDGRDGLAHLLTSGSEEVEEGSGVVKLESEAVQNAASTHVELYHSVNLLTVM